MNATTDTREPQLTHPNLALLDGTHPGHTLILGDSGTGKSMDMAHLIAQHALDDEPLIVIAGNHQGLAEQALGLIPPHRKVLWVDPSNPACPWALGGVSALEPGKEPVDIIQVWQNRQVLLVHLDEGKLGRARAGALGRRLLVQLHNALAQRVAPGIQGTLMIDEATYLLEATGMALAENGQALGLRLIVSAQSRDVVTSPVIRWSLLPNARQLLAHHTAHGEAAQYIAAHLRIAPPALRQLTRHAAIGNRDRADRASIAIHTASPDTPLPYHADWAEHHRQHQP